MKKVLLLPLLVSLFFACKKDAATTDAGPDVTPGQDKRPLQISIADFIKEEEDMRSARKVDGNSQQTAKEDSARLSDIYYVAYNSNGDKVSFLHQDTVNNKSNFGTISDSLAPGSYTIVLIASEKPLTTSIGYSSNISGHFIAPLILGGFGIDPLGDVFYKKIPVEINVTENPANLEVTLNRIVGKLELNIIDALPASGPNGYILVQVIPFHKDFKLADETLSPPDTIMQWFGTRRSQQTFRDYLFGSSSEFNVIINYKDKNTGAALTKTIEHVTVHTNKKTVVSGYLYGVPNNPGGPDYQIKLNQSWDSDSTVIKF